MAVSPEELKDYGIYFGVTAIGILTAISSIFTQENACLFSGGIVLAALGLMGLHHTRLKYRIEKDDPANEHTVIIDGEIREKKE